MIRLKTMEEFDDIANQFEEKGMVSPGGAAGYLGVSRAYIHQLEKDKRIRAYRIKSKVIALDKLPYVFKLLIGKPVFEDYIYIPVEDLDSYREEVKQRGRKKK